MPNPGPAEASALVARDQYPRLGGSRPSSGIVLSSQTLRSQAPSGSRSKPKVVEVPLHEGREDALQAELECLFREQNTASDGTAQIPATYLRVVVAT
jgi:hypothetical protein